MELYNNQFEFQNCVSDADVKLPCNSATVSSEGSFNYIAVTLVAGGSADSGGRSFVVTSGRNIPSTHTHIHIH